MINCCVVIILFSLFDDLPSRLHALKHTNRDRDKTNQFEDLIDGFKVFHVERIGIWVSVSEDVGCKNNRKIARIHFGFAFILADLLETLEEMLRHVFVGARQIINDRGEFLHKLVWRVG